MLKKSSNKLLILTIAVIFGCVSSLHLQAQIEIRESLYGKWHSEIKTAGIVELDFFDSNKAIYKIDSFTNIKISYRIDRLNNQNILVLIFPNSFLFKYFIWLSGKDKIKLQEINRGNYNDPTKENADENSTNNFLLIKQSKE